MCNDEQSNVVCEPDAPESQEGEQGARVGKNESSVGSNPVNIGQDLSNQGCEAEKRGEDGLIAGLASCDDITVRAGDVEEQTESTKSHESVVEGKVEAAKVRADKVDLGQTSYIEDTSVPEDGSSHEASERIDEDNHENTFDRTAEGGKEECTCVELFPCGKVEVGERSNERARSPDGSTEVERSAAEHTFEGSVDRVAAVVEELTEGASHTCPSRLLSINRVQTLVHEQAQRPGVEDPGRQTSACRVGARCEVDLGSGARNAEVGKERTDWKQGRVRRESRVERKRVCSGIELELCRAFEARISVSKSSKVYEDEKQTRESNGVGSDAGWEERD